MAENPRIIAGRYEVGSLIGRGGMADVYEGVDTRLGRVVAIKVLKADLANDPNFESRFREEAQASARMAHPTIVRVYDAGEELSTDGNGNPVRRPYIVMEYVRGTLLRDLLHNRRLTQQEAVDYTTGVLTALEFSHRAGVIHRDIKGANIMIAENGQVKVMDFGIARAISEGSSTQAHTSGIVGTAQYFSPEQARGEQVDARTDLYSTGVLLYEMLAGRPPFKGETAVSVAYQHVSEAVTPPSVHNPAITPAMDAVVLRALAKDRNDRFQTAEQFRDNLLAAAQTSGNRTVELAPIAATPPVAPAAPADPFDAFEAMLREASGEATGGIEIVSAPIEHEPEVVVADPILPIDASLSPAPAEPRLEHVGLNSHEPRRSAADTELLNTQTNPFASLGVDLGRATTDTERAKRAPQVSNRQTGLLWGAGSGLIVVVFGLIIWLFTLGPINIHIEPTASGVAVADVVNQPYQSGYDALIAQKLLVIKTYETSDTVAAETIIRTDPAAGVRVSDNTTITVYVSSGKNMVKMPNLVGMTEEDAIAALQLAKLTLGTITPANSASLKAGTIISTDPMVNVSIAEGSIVNLISSNGKVMVPDVTNLDISEAKNKLTAVDVGLTVTVDTFDVCDTTLGTVVQSQSIAPGLTAQRSAIVLYVECLP